MSCDAGHLGDCPTYPNSTIKGAIPLKQKKQWFAYLPLDRKGVEAYLNDQAAKGWALAAEQDGMTFRVPFQETNLTDLRYNNTYEA